MKNLNKLVKTLKLMLLAVFTLALKAVVLSAVYGVSARLAARKTGLKLSRTWLYGHKTGQF